MARTYRYRVGMNNDTMTHSDTLALARTETLAHYGITWDQHAQDTGITLADFARAYGITISD